MFLHTMIECEMRNYLDKDEYYNEDGSVNWSLMREAVYRIYAALNGFEKRRWNLVNEHRLFEFTGVFNKIKDTLEEERILATAYFSGAVDTVGSNEYP